MTFQPWGFNGLAAVQTSNQLYNGTPYVLGVPNNTNAEFGAGSSTTQKTTTITGFSTNVNFGIVSFSFTTAPQTNFVSGDVGVLANFTSVNAALNGLAVECYDVTPTSFACNFLPATAAYSNGSGAIISPLQGIPASPNFASGLTSTETRMPTVNALNQNTEPA
jgi:hypothetical protein